MDIGFDEDFDEDNIRFLKNIGHNYTFSDFPAIVTAISKVKGHITASSDYRRQGRSAGF